MRAPNKSQPPKLLDEVRQVLRLHHYSIHTERSYVDWIIQFAHFHHMHSRQDLIPPECKIEAFLTHLVVEKVAAATQNRKAVCGETKFSARSWPESAPTSSHEVPPLLVARAQSP